jgi:hypothetical protein
MQFPKASCYVLRLGSEERQTRANYHVRVCASNLCVRVKCTCENVVTIHRDQDGVQRRTLVDAMINLRIP